MKLFSQKNILKMLLLDGIVQRTGIIYSFSTFSSIDLMLCQRQFWEKCCSQYLWMIQILFSKTTSVHVFSKTGRKSDFSALKGIIISLSKINFIFIASFFSVFLGPKGSKTAKLLQSSNQEYMATCEDVILTKLGGIIQIPRYSHRTTMRWGRNVYYEERSLWMILWQAATLA